MLRCQGLSLMCHFTIYLLFLVMLFLFLNFPLGYLNICFIFPITVSKVLFYSQNEFPWVTVISHHKLGGTNSSHLFYNGAGGWTSEVKVVAESCSFRSLPRWSLPCLSRGLGTPLFLSMWWQNADLWPCLHTVLSCVCVFTRSP